MDDIAQKKKWIICNCWLGHSPHKQHEASSQEAAAPTGWRCCHVLSARVAGTETCRESCVYQLCWPPPPAAAEPQWSRSCSSTCTTHEWLSQRGAKGSLVSESTIPTKGSSFGGLSYLLSYFSLLSLHCWLQRAVASCRSTGVIPITYGPWMLSLPIDMTGSKALRDVPWSAQVHTSCPRGASQAEHQMQGKGNDISESLSPEKPQ